jgi:cysteinyl-tRNA synthetase
MQNGPVTTRVRHPEKLGDKLSEPDAHDASFIVLYEGWLEDLERLHRSLSNHLGSHDWELVVVDNPVSDADSEAISALERVVHVPLTQKVGYGGGRNLGIRLAAGKIVIVLDTSVQLTGDVLAPVAAHLEDDSVGLVGRWGVVTSDGFHYEEAKGPDVDGVEAYVMAARRTLLSELGLFDPKFKWYRNADLDYSFKVRASGRRTIVDASLPLTRHAHRLWESTPEAERDEMSRRNFWRFRDHWGDREDLLTHPRG